MSKRLLLGFKILVVVASMSTAGWLLWQAENPRLTDIEFETITSTSTAETSVTTNPAANTVTNTVAVDTTVAEATTTTVNTVVPEPTPADDIEVITEPDTIETSTSTSTAPTTTANGDSTAADEAAVLVSVLGPGVQQRCAVVIASATTVHKVMQLASSQCGFSYNGEKQGSLGFFVKEIAGLKQSVKDGYYWIFSVNGEKSQQGVSTRTVTADDTVQWTYEAEY